MMKKKHMLLVVFLLPCLLTACRRDVPQNHITDLPATADNAGMMMNTGADVAVGEVIETMDAGNYTYVQIDTGTEKLWAAAPSCEVKIGDKLGISKAMPMKDWRSDKLDRQFDLVYFVGGFQKGDGSAVMGGGHGMGGPAAAGGQPAAGHAAGPTDVDVGTVEKAEGGKTVAEVYAEKADLSGKEIKLRGKVTKYNAAILGVNWLHVQDGSGDPNVGDHDLTVTTAATAKVGDTVLVTGKLQLDKDFGAGYKYSIIVEDAQVVVE